MADRLYLSCWLRGYTGANMLRHFEKMLGVFPFSKLAARGPVLRIYALEHLEPPQFEREFPPGTGAKEMVEQARDFTHEDCLVEIDAAWDLWQFDGDWKLAPAAVLLSCFGPEFENETGDHVRIEFGNDARFLPNPHIEGGPRMAQSNLKSLVTLVHQIEQTLQVERRQLWSESGVSPVDLIAQEL
ncbi:MAG: hypothetical protein LAO79_27905 [Acidobacteriia bacterium]|nr:hypothetical protein [Terriglobia bacterium]